MRSLLILTLALSPLAAQHHHHHDESLDWSHNDQETIRRSFTLAAGADRKLVIDNVSGYVHVSGTDGSQVQVSVERHNRAESADRLEAAKRQVKLRISQQGNTVDVFEDGPFRNGNDGINYRGDSHYGYLVTFDYDVQVPRDIELVLKNFNHGDIYVKDTSGKFSVHGFNGAITMDQVAGFGTVHTFNGPVKVTYSRNPEQDTEFHTFNGSVDVYFQPDLNADVQFKTFNGGVYSDFEVGPVAVKTSGRLDNTRFIWRSGRSGSGRIGKGGASLSFHGFNGPIRLHAKNQ